MTPVRRTKLGLLLIAATLALTACADDGNPAVGSAPSTGSASATAAAPAADPFLGKVVTVSGRVTDLVGIDAFLLSGESWRGEPLKVVDVDDVAVGDGQPVRVSGVVRVFDKPLFEKEYSVTLGSPDLAEWAGDHVIVANVIEPVGAG